ncbi:hypothetical protein [Sulfidibacter corallicola]|uniref:Uncharacterized protein n=1 Tax=Sulfidibacter corallicola TaxID=2818388 RepID=A0A8A4TYE4_SULCO|nr:hypothetical protein [Sulfidibacter corallicola]QTD54248.1 hypothetical protein J3U87_17525 [Sulfidibacter corallicola]
MDQGLPGLAFEEIVQGNGRFLTRSEYNQLFLSEDGFSWQPLGWWIEL